MGKSAIKTKIFTKRNIPGPTGPTGSVGGTGVAHEVAVWSAVTTLASYPGFTWNTSTKIFNSDFGSTAIFQDENNVNIRLEVGNATVELLNDVITLDTLGTVLIGDTIGLGNQTTIAVDDSAQNVILTATNGVQVPNLGGGGTQMVTVDNLGILGKQTIPSTSGTAGGDLAGTYPNPTVAQSSTAFALNGVISPTVLTTNANNYNPTGLSTASVLRLTSTIDISITGIVGGVAGRILIIHNIGANVLRLRHENASSTAANRFTITGGGWRTVNSGASCILQYDGTTARWRTLGSPLYGTTGGSNANEIAVSGVEDGQLVYSSNLFYSPTTGEFDAGNGTVAFTVDPTNNAGHYRFTHRDINIGGNILTFPASSTAGSLTNDGTGNLSWSASGNGVTIANTLYVSENGNDGTGTRERLDLPYATLIAATAAATSGDTIIVYPGIYVSTDQLVLVDQVNYEFLGTGVYQIADGINAPLITDGATSVSCTIFAPEWDFKASTTDGAAGIELGGSSLVSFILRDGYSTDFSFVNAYGSGTELTINARDLDCANDFLTVSGSSGTILNCTARTITNHIFDGYCVYSTGALNLKVHSLLSTSTQGYCVYVDSTDNVYIEFDKMKSGADSGDSFGWTCWLLGTGNAYIKGQLIEGNGDCTLVAAEGRQMVAQVDHINNLRTTDDCDGVVHAEGADTNLTLIGTKITRARATGADLFVSNAAATLKIIGVSYSIVDDFNNVITRIDNRFRTTHGDIIITDETGWSTMAGTATKGGFNTASVTLPQLAQVVKALTDYMFTTTKFLKA